MKKGEHHPAANPALPPLCAVGCNLFHCHRGLPAGRHPTALRSRARRPAAAGGGWWRAQSAPRTFGGSLGCTPAGCGRERSGHYGVEAAWGGWWGRASWAGLAAAECSSSKLGRFQCSFFALALSTRLHGDDILNTPLRSPSPDTTESHPCKPSPSPHTATCPASPCLPLPPASPCHLQRLVEPPHLGLAHSVLLHQGDWGEEVGEHGVSTDAQSWVITAAGGGAGSAALLPGCRLRGRFERPCTAGETVQVGTGLCC